LTGVSIVFIVVTATMLIATAEREVNALWGIAHSRPLGRRVFLYLIGATAGPVLVGASISISTWLITQSLAAVPAQDAETAHPAATPLAFSTLALAFFYTIIPARRVPWRLHSPAPFSVRWRLRRRRFAFYSRMCRRTKSSTRARRTSGVPHLDLRLLDHRAGRRCDHGDADAAFGVRAAPRNERASMVRVERGFRRRVERPSRRRLPNPGRQATLRTTF
jgi:hypothetical protein